MAFENSLSYSWDALVKQFSSVHATLPPASYFKLPPSPLPRTLFPPSDHPTLAHPFTISPYWYNRLLSPQVPVTAALVYVTVVTILNSINQRRKFKPWAFSKTSFFKLMVITHNTILALYSAWTFVGMLNALNASVVPPWEQYGLAGTVDSLCKINGPRGYGSAATYNETTSAWGIANRVFHLGADGLEPDQTDVGRIWNEGLAFYGWLFYLSKYYEVIDTLIILAKGKKSSFLQTYHHAGAMLCMWAGIRYMSPPIWMFVLFNSFIHSIMYSFYLCSALDIRPPMWFKRTLTTLQITQFVLGAIYAFAHLFVKYRSPLNVPYIYHLGNVASTAPSVASTVVSTVTATASADTAAQIKKWLLRAAGREGLAENVLNRQGNTFGVDAVHAANDFVAREEVRYRRELNWVHCLDTSGQAFAIYLNCLYLAPLTWLFARFFIKSYLRRDERRRSSSTSQKAFLSGRDAYKGVSRRLSEAFEHPQEGVEGNGDDIAIIDGDELNEEVKKIASATRKGMSDALDVSKDKADQLKAKAKSEFQTDFDRAKQALEEAKSSLASSTSELVQKGDHTQATLSQKSREVKSSISETTQSITQRIQESSRSVLETVSQSISKGHEDGTQAGGGQQEKSIISSVSDTLKDKAQAANDTLNQISSVIQEKIKPGEASETGKPHTADGNTDQNTKLAQNTAKDGDENAQDDAQIEQAESAPQDDNVRQADSEEKKTPAEATTGESKPGHSAAEEPPSKDNTTKDNSTEKLGEEEPSSQDDGPKEHSAEDHSSEGGRAEGDAAESPVNQYDDQQSSWIHVKHDTEEAIENAIESVQGKIEDLKAEALADRDVAKEPATQESQQSDTSETNDEIQRPSGASGKAEQDSTSSTKNEEEPRVEPDASDSTSSKAGPLADESKDESANKEDEPVPGENATGEDTEKSSQAPKKEPKPETQAEQKEPTYAEVAAEAVKDDSAETSTGEGGKSLEQQGIEDVSAPGASNDANSRSDEPDSKAADTASKSDEDAKETTNKPGTGDPPTGTTNTAKSTVESAVNGVKTDSNPATAEGESVVKSADDEPEQLKSGSATPGDGTLWFEKLTTGIDLKGPGEAEKKEVDKIIDESEPVRDEVVADTKEGVQQPTTETSEVVEKKEVDKIIDESEPLRDEVVTDTKEGIQEQNTKSAVGNEEDSSNKENNPEAGAKEHEDGA